MPDTEETKKAENGWYRKYVTDSLESLKESIGRIEANGTTNYDKLEKKIETLALEKDSKDRHDRLTTKVDELQNSNDHQHNDIKRGMHQTPCAQLMQFKTEFNTGKNLIKFLFGPLAVMVIIAVMAQLFQLIKGGLS